jgi:hypothetical protein
MATIVCWRGCTSRAGDEYRKQVEVALGEIGHRLGRTVLDLWIGAQVRLHRLAGVQ